MDRVEAEEIGAARGQPLGGRGEVGVIGQPPSLGGRKLCRGSITPQDRGGIGRRAGAEMSVQTDAPTVRS
jgi:hypothetical protein